MIQEGQWLWSPSKEFVDSSFITKFMTWLSDHRGLTFASYADLHNWSVTQLDAYWSAVWSFFDIQTDAPFKRVLDAQVMPDTKWFEGARVNYAEHVLRAASLGSLGRTAIVSMSEVRSMSETSWGDLSQQVVSLATSLRDLGIRPGDRVVSYMPNVPETVVALLATVAVGGIWSSAAPEFGIAAVVDRFSQIEPKLIFAADGYRFNGRDFDRRESLEKIVGSLPTLEHLVWLPYLDTSAKAPSVRATIREFGELSRNYSVSVADFKFERVAYDHPLWILYSSGTTGLPKAIVHSHVGMLVTHLSINAFHFNLGPQSRLFFYTTTGWMVFNTLISALLGGGSIVTYDGSPTHPSPGFLWKLVADAKATGFGASPTFVQGMQKSKIRPGEMFDLSSIDFVLCTGSPALPETFEWFYDAVKRDIWVTSTSGGTDICGPIVGAGSRRGDPVSDSRHRRSSFR